MGWLRSHAVGGEGGRPEQRRHVQSLPTRWKPNFADLDQREECVGDETCSADARGAEGLNKLLEPARNMKAKVR